MQGARCRLVFLGHTGRESASWSIVVSHRVPQGCFAKAVGEGVTLA